VVIGSGMPKELRNDSIIYGGPYLDPYIPRVASAPDGQLEAITVILDPRGVHTLMVAMNASGSAGAMLNVDLLTEPGAWNDVFLGIGFKVFNGFYLAGDAAVIIFGLLTLFNAMWKSFLGMDIRVQVIIGAQCAIIFQAISTSLQWHSWTRIIFDALAHLVFNGCLYYILVFWMITMQSVRLFSFPRVFCGLLVLGAVAALFLFAALLTDALRTPDTVSQALLIAAWASTSIVDLFVLALFILQAVQLFRHRSVIVKELSQDAAIVLIRLIILVPLAILAIWTQALIQIVLVSAPAVAGSIGSVATIWIIGRLMLLVRAAGFVLGLSVNVMIKPGAEGFATPKNAARDWK